MWNGLQGSSTLFLLINTTFGFPSSYVVVLFIIFIFNDLRWGVIVDFVHVDIGGIVDHCCLNFIIHLTGMILFFCLTDFSYFHLNIFSQMLQDTVWTGQYGPFESGYWWFQLFFFINFQIFYFLTRIIPDLKFKEISLLSIR